MKRLIASIQSVSAELDREIISIERFRDPITERTLVNWIQRQKEKGREGLDKWIRDRAGPDVSDKQRRKRKTQPGKDKGVQNPFWEDVQRALVDELGADQNKVTEFIQKAIKNKKKYQSPEDAVKDFRSKK